MSLSGTGEAPVLIAGVWLESEGRVLLLQRGYGRAEGVWVPPGGLVEDGESPADAAVRETFEETGIRISEPRLLHTFEWPDERRRRVFQFLAKATSSLVTLSDEHTDFRWMAPRDYARDYLALRPGASTSARGWLYEMRQAAERVAAALEQR